MLDHDDARSYNSSHSSFDESANVARDTRHLDHQTTLYWLDRSPLVLSRRLVSGKQLAFCSNPTPRQPARELFPRRELAAPRSWTIGPIPTHLISIISKRRHLRPGQPGAVP